jgi:hypothetical protein
MRRSIVGAEMDVGAVICLALGDDLQPHLPLLGDAR